MLFIEITGAKWSKKETRERVIQTVAGWGGELIEIPYTERISSTKLNCFQEDQHDSPAADEKTVRAVRGQGTSPDHGGEQWTHKANC